MADKAVALVAQAERDLADGNVRGALSGLEGAYIPVQTNRDLATVDRALAVAQQAMASVSSGSREHRKARRIAEWYAELQRSYSMNAPMMSSVANTPLEGSAVAAQPRLSRPEPCRHWSGSTP